MPVIPTIRLLCVTQSQVVLLQTAHSWANAGVLLGARMHREPSCVYEIPRLLSLLVLACMLIYDRCMIVV